MLPPETALSPLVGLFQSIQIFTAVSQAHPLKKNLQIFDEWFKVRQLRRQNREKSEEKKLLRLFLIFRRRRRLKSTPNRTILFLRPSL